MGPSVSVLMPMRNAAPYVRAAAESILGQTFEDFEMIVVDDASEDDGAALIAALGDRRVRILRNEQRRGVTGSLNRALAEARGSLLARMDADDLSQPDRFRRQVEYLRAHPEVVLVGTNGWRVDQAGRPLEALSLPTDPLLLGWELHFGNHILHPSVMLRAAVVRDAGGYAGGYAEDYQLWVRLAARHRLANLPERLVSLRQHARQATQVHHAETIGDADRARGQALRLLLGRDLPDDAVRWWGQAARGEPLDSARAVGTVARLLAIASRAYLRRWASASAGAAEVGRRAARRLLTLVHLNGRRHPSASGLALARAIVEDPATLAALAEQIARAPSPTARSSPLPGPLQQGE